MGEYPVIAKVYDYLKTGIWRVRREDLPLIQAVWIKILRIAVMTIRRSKEDRVQLRASSLTFYSLLSIVPILALLFGIAKGFGLDRILEQQLLERATGQEQALAKIIDFARNLLQTTKGGVVAGIGVVVLFWTIIRVFGNIEDSFNQIWNIHKSRPFWRKVTDYLSLSLICPFFFILSSAATVVIMSQVRSATETISLLAPVNPALQFIVRLLPYTSLSVLLTFIYIFLPNTRVSFKSALTAGIIIGTVYVLFQRLYLHFQIGVAKYNAIYGSLAALPLFLIWLQLSWLIVLIGGEISYAHQNVDNHECIPDCSQISYATRKLVALGIVWLLTKQFATKRSTLTEEDIAHKLALPRALVVGILPELVRAGVVSIVITDNGEEVAYQPGRDTECLTIQAVVHAIEHNGLESIELIRSAHLQKLRNWIDRLEGLLADSSLNIPLKDIPLDDGQFG